MITEHLLIREGPEGHRRVRDERNNGEQSQQEDIELLGVHRRFLVGVCHGESLNHVETQKGNHAHEEEYWHDGGKYHCYGAYSDNVYVLAVDVEFRAAVQVHKLLH